MSFTDETIGENLKVPAEGEVQVSSLDELLKERDSRKPGSDEKSNDESEKEDLEPKKVKNEKIKEITGGFKK